MAGQDFSERRRSYRALLHWTVRLWRDGDANPLRTEAANISRHGFYCLLDRPVLPGEWIKCEITVPIHSPQDPEAVIHLRCNAQAVRVEQLADGREFGLACRLDDFSFSPETS